MSRFVVKHAPKEYTGVETSVHFLESQNFDEMIQSMEGDDLEFRSIIPLSGGVAMLFERKDYAVSDKA